MEDNIFTNLFNNRPARSKSPRLRYPRVSHNGTQIRRTTEKTPNTQQRNPTLKQ